VIRPLFPGVTLVVGPYLLRYAISPQHITPEPITMKSGRA